MFASQLTQQHFAESGLIERSFSFNDFYQYKESGARGTGFNSQIFENGLLTWQASANIVDDVNEAVVILRENVRVESIKNGNPLLLTGDLLFVDVDQQIMTSPDRVYLSYATHKSEGEDFMANMQTGKMTYRFGSSIYAPTTP